MLAASDVPLGYSDFGKKSTVVRALGELRTICSNKVLNAGIKIGGLGKTVEIDELKFGAKRKYKRGRVSEGPVDFPVLTILFAPLHTLNIETSKQQLKFQPRGANTNARLPKTKTRIFHINNVNFNTKTPLGRKTL